MGIFVCKEKTINCKKEIVDEFTDYKVFLDDSREEKYYQSYETKDAFCISYGNIYETNVDIKDIYNIYKSYGSQKLMDVDGDFLFICIERSGNVMVVSDREGIIPLYYRQDDIGIALSTTPEYLFNDYSEKDIDFNAVNSFLRFGTLIGEQTFSKKVKLLEGGKELRYRGNSIEVFRHYFFHYNKDEKFDKNELVYNVYDTYKKSIKKRVKQRETGILLSGGLDSRFLLAASNECLENRLHTVSFGQKLSEEVEVARKCAGVKGNPFQWICTNPEMFVDNIEKYCIQTCGMDMFPQSYIIDAIKQTDLSHFMTGFALDAYMGGTFLTYDCINTEKRLSDFIGSNLKSLKMQCFSDETLKILCYEKAYKEFDGCGIGQLQKIAEEYDSVSVEDGVQSFGINTRAKRIVLQREVVPGRYVEYINPSIDKEFLRTVAKIPATLRLEHRFYQELFCTVAKDYSEICYNNTTLPVYADLELWKKGSSNELQREKIYEQIIKKHNDNNSEKIYYPHFYSDFNGFSRYNNSWHSVFDKYLLNENSFICSKWFEHKKLEEMFENHKNGKANYRKELIYLTSLEIFFQTFLFRNKDMEY